MSLAAELVAETLSWIIAFLCAVLGLLRDANGPPRHQKQRGGGESALELSLRDDQLDAPTPSRNDVSTDLPSQVPGLPQSVLDFQRSILQLGPRIRSPALDGSPTHLDAQVPRAPNAAVRSPHSPRPLGGGNLPYVANPSAPSGRAALRFL